MAAIQKQWCPAVNVRECVYLPEWPVALRQRELSTFIGENRLSFGLRLDVQIQNPKYAQCDTRTENEATEQKSRAKPTQYSWVTRSLRKHAG